MSSTEIHTGKLKVVYENIGTGIKGYALYEKMVNVALALGYVVQFRNEWEVENAKEAIAELGYEYGIYTTYVDGFQRIYHIENHVEGEEEDIFAAFPNPDKSIDFVLSFYNGSTCLSEQIEEILKRYAK